MKKFIILIIFLCRIIGVNSQNIYEQNYGDSAKGFDEASLKPQLLANNVYGKEYINYINILKRQYINQKYKIGPTFTPIQNQNPTIGNKPIGGGAIINVAPCVNEDFELSTPGQYTGINSITGWTIETGQNSTQIIPPNTSYGSACNANPVAAWTPGSPEFSIVATPIIGNPGLNPFSINNITIPQSPLGGNNVARLNNSSPTGRITRISTQFPVTNANTLFQFCYAGSWDGVHDCCGQPAFRIDMYNCTGSLIPIPCANVSLTPSGQQCQSGVPGYQVTNGVSWVNWQTKYIDLTPYIGQCIRMVVTNSDCSYSGHHGTAYFDARCGGQLIGQGLGGVGGNIPGPVSFCAGSNQAVIAAPLGYSTYQWIAPGTPPTTISAQQGGTAPTLTISPVISGAVYTVQLNSPSGCSYIATNTILPSVVNIAGIGSGSTCPGGASGTATVQGNGSGTGYNYTWLNSNSVTVGTASTASGLAPGIYSVVISGFGAAGCGSAVATTTVNVAPPGVINLLKPYCGSEAYLSTNGGSNFHWYNNNTLITGTVGAQANYTVSNPCNLCIYRLSYLSVQGCQDSIVFTLVSSPPGVMNVSNVSLVCPGGTNGTAVVSMTPAAGSPPGANSFSVFSTGQTPAYTSSLYPTPLTAFTPTGLAAGSYSVSTFDGSCKYGTTFNVSTYNYTWGINPVVDTLCSGNAVAAGITISYQSHPSVFSYSWSPSSFLAGNTQQQTIVSPTCVPGTSVSLIYTITVTPNIISCVTTKTMNIVVANPATPTLGVIPPLCNNGNQVNIVATPSGGIFTGANANVIGSSTGILTPTFAANGTNTYTYSHNVYGCVATNTGTFQVSQFNSAALTAVIPSLCVTNNPVNLNNIVQSTVTGVWSVPTNPSIISNNGGVFLFNPSGLNTNIYNAYYNTSSTPNPTVCPDVTILPISVTKTITPYITPVPAFCNNASAINLTVSPSGGIWSGNGAVNNSIINPSLATIPSSTLNYSVMVGPCLNTATTTLLTSNFNTASLTGVINNLCFNSNPVNLLSITQNTTGVWSGYNVNNNIFTPNGLPTGNYNLIYNTTSFPNNTLCPDSKTININVSNPPTPNITQVGPFCSKDLPIQLTASPNIGFWQTTPYLNSIGIFTPSNSIIGSNSIVYSIGNQTCFTQQIKNINVEDYQPSTITSSIPDLCITSNVFNLSNIVLNNNGVWSGVGINGNIFYPNIGAGTFILTYQNSTTPSNLCSNQSTVSVNVYSLSTPNITQIGPFCNKSLPNQLQVSPLGGLFGGVNNNAISLGGLFNPALAFIGDNIVSYSISVGPCIAYAQTTVSVEKFVSASFESYPGPYCRDNDPVNMNSFVKNPNIFWSGLGMIGNMFNPSKANIGDNMVYHYTNSSPTSSLCPDKDSISIFIKDIPEVNITSDIKKGCSPLEITFNSNLLYGSGIWEITDGYKNQTDFKIKHTFTKPGNYNVNYYYNDGICNVVNSKIDSIIIYNTPKSNFDVTPEISIVDNTNYQLVNLSENLLYNNYIWKINNMVSYDINPVIDFPKVGSYKITLISITTDGCKDSITKNVNVYDEFRIYIPTYFTPNNDGLNDTFYPVTHFIKKYNLMVFDRWGELIYNFENGKWDGRYKGEIVKEGIYTWKIMFYREDGYIVEKTGRVGLLR